MGSTDSTTYLIIGAGVFGSSTALHLAQSVPGARIVLVDRTFAPFPSAASSDVNKIVRADYADIEYMKLALEAVGKWRDDKLYSPWYHESGMLLADVINMGRGSIANYKKLGLDVGARYIKVDEARAKFPQLKHANWTDVDEMFYNPRSGWAEADQAVKAVFDAAVAAGVHFVPATVERLLFDDSGDCTGAVTDTGETLSAEFILCCTGARTARLFADSAPKRDDIQVNNRLTAAGAVSCLVKCDLEYRHLYEHAPVHILGMPHTDGENVPLDPHGRIKFNLELSFTRLEYHEASGQTFSCPPSPPSQSRWSQDVPAGLKKNVSHVVESIYGKDAPGLSIESFRMCWDSVTRSQDWIISPIPSCKHLYLAAGGSFHSWKFLPVLGKYVSQMLHGELSDTWRGKWAWDRPAGAPVGMYWPEKDIKDIPGYEDLSAH